MKRDKIPKKFIFTKHKTIRCSLVQRVYIGVNNPSHLYANYFLNVINLFIELLRIPCNCRQIHYVQSMISE